MSLDTGCDVGEFIADLFGDGFDMFCFANDDRMVVAVLMIALTSPFPSPPMVGEDAH